MSTGKKNSQDKSSYENSLRDFISHLAERIDVIKEKNKGFNVETRIKFNEQIDFLKLQKATLSEKLHEVSNLSEREWDEVKANLIDGMSQLKKESEEIFEDAKSGFTKLLNKLK